MSTTWRLTLLEDWVKANRPEDKHAAELIKSLSRSAFILDYHLILARDAFAELEGPDGNGLKLFAAMANFEPSFSRAALAHEANTLAAVHTIRNYADIFAQLANALVMPKPLQIHDCDFFKVADNLPPSILKEKMQALKDSYWFRYLAAFSNISKHRHLIQSKPTAVLKENVIGLRIKEFPYKFNKRENETTFKQCWAHDLLEEIHNVYRSILELGQELNRHVMN
ncbi:hypothetical protein [Aquipseudomonas alcaligenes]|uniref:DUF4158 domain-containing protein n=1 Tax=Aquipseudomonas alcaligenes TaxID=43263 RepID=A0AB73HX61_AQUAC|nr:hypothetical protein [Pseudomonas alcaligenes]MDH0141143.1 hypothetical protein [Pseudomonas alcaligenes]